MQLPDARARRHDQGADARRPRGHARPGRHAAGHAVQAARQGHAERVGPRPGRPPRDRARRGAEEALQGTEAPARGARPDAAAGEAGRRRRPTARSRSSSASKTSLAEYPALDLRFPPDRRPAPCRTCSTPSSTTSSRSPSTSTTADGWRVFFRAARGARRGRAPRSRPRRSRTRLAIEPRRGRRTKTGRGAARPALTAIARRPDHRRPVLGPASADRSRRSRIDPHRDRSVDGLRHRPSRRRRGCAWSCCSELDVAGSA